MQRESGKIFLACALGAGIGSLVALELAAAFWWVGLLVGGAVGYLSYESRQVRMAVPKAWKAARGWRSPPMYWRNLACCCAVAACILSWTVPLIAAVDLTSRTALWEVNWVVGIGTGIAFVAVLFSFLACAFMCASPIVGLFEDPDLSPSTSSRQILRSGFAPIILFWNVPRALPDEMRFLGRFLRELFVRIHSEQRLICGVDALLGAGIGYAAGSAIVGAIVGGILGVLNYELVTLRWLAPRGYVTIEK